MSLFNNVGQWNLSIEELVPVVVTDNVMKDKINSEMACSFAVKSGLPLHEFVSVDVVNSSANNDPSLPLIINLHSGKTSGHLRTLPLVVEMPIMITTNVDLNGGIINGSISTVRKMFYHEDSNGTLILDCCIVHIPSAQTPQMMGLAVNEYPIFSDMVYVHHCGVKSKQSISFKQTQVPLIPAFAMTAHKSQGQTLDKAIIDLKDCHGTEAGSLSHAFLCSSAR